MPSLSYFEDLLDDNCTNLEKKQYVEKHKDKVWNFRKELKKTSAFKTSIVAKSCLLFLQDSINFQIQLLQAQNLPCDFILHPFTSEVTTLATYSYKMFLNFYLNKEQIYAVMHETTSKMKNISRGELELALMRENKYPDLHYQHAFSSPAGQKRFGIYEVDLYSPVSKTVTQYHGCEVHCHLPPKCKNPNRQNLKFDTCTSIYGKSAAQVKLEQEKFEHYLQENFPNEVEHITYVYECRWKKFKKSQQWLNFQKNYRGNLNRPLEKLIPRVGMRGGLLDVYKLRWLKSENPNETFKVADINGLYAYVCMTKAFPVGKCVTIIGSKLALVTVKDNLLCYKGWPLESGSMHCTVVAPQSELAPYLQYRVSDKFNYLALCRMCAKENKLKCLHRSEKSKSFTSVWTIADLNKALRENYHISNIFEVHFFKETKYLLQNFVQCLSSFRLKNSGGLDELPSLEDKQAYCERHNAQMNLPECFALSVKNVINNQRQKMLFKDMSNSLFGKFSQNSNIKKTEIVWSQHRLEELASQFDILEIYNLSESSVMVEYESSLNEPNRKGNVYIGSEINAHARIIIHDYIKILQSKGIQVYAVDTDCLFYSVPNNVTDPLPFSDSIGDFKSVIPQNCEILNFHSLGCRNYSILYKDDKGNLHTIVKVKGLSLKSSHLSHPIDSEMYENYIETHFQNEYQSLVLPQIKQMAVKPSFHLKPNLRTFEFKNDLFLKRYVKKNDLSYNTYPYGYIPGAM
jgi:hypothetical protein